MKELHEHYVQLLLTEISEAAVACGIADPEQAPFDGPLCIMFLRDIKESYLEMKHRLEGLEK